MPLPINKTFQTWGAVFAILVSIAGAIIGIDGYFAHADALGTLEIKFETKILTDRSDRIQDRIWKLEDKYTTRKQAPPEIQESWRLMEKEKVDTDTQIKQNLDKLNQRK
jgi:hypothetical protein